MIEREAREERLSKWQRDDEGCSHLTAISGTAPFSSDLYPGIQTVEAYAAAGGIEICAQAFEPTGPRI